MSGGSYLQVRYRKSFTSVVAKGTKDSLAEVGEQLSWLGAACRQSSHQEMISYCTPVCVPVEVPGVSSIPCFRVRFEETDLAQSDSGTKPNGTCWHSLFRNPVIVRGYPILARHPEETGLESPLNMMASLANVIYATEFEGEVLIKGISSILVPTQRIQNSILWHFMYKEDGTYMPYPSAREHGRCSNFDGSDAVDLSCLGSSRHFVGWTSSSVLRAGNQFLPSQITYPRLTNRLWARKMSDMMRLNIQAI